jgi:unsaturated rhamnogalacturonyl hydrolase
VYKSMKKFPLLIIVAFLVSCSGNKDKYIDWSIKIASSLMAKHDSLINFQDRKEVWQYDYSLLAGAIGKLTDYTHNRKYFRYFKDYVDFYITEEGKIKYYRLEEYNLDKIRPGINLFPLFHKTGEKKYETALKSQIEQMKTHPRTNDGGFWHKKVYPFQMWLDGIYMACPFMAQYAVEFNEPQWFDEIEKQMTQIYSHTLDEKTGLLYHAWDESRSQRWCDSITGRSKHFWSRALGWYAMAIVDVLDFMPESHPGYKKLVEILNNISAALVKVQDEKTGLWYQVLDMGGREGNYLEASGSSMFVYTFAKGVRKGYLPQSYLQSAEKGFQGLCDNLVKPDPEGGYILTQTCGGCGLGGNPYRDGSYEYYVTEKIKLNDPKGLAPLILAGMELSDATEK